MLHNKKLVGFENSKRQCSHKYFHFIFLWSACH